jgi:hypothetical protein
MPQRCCSGPSVVHYALKNERRTVPTLIAPEPVQEPLSQIALLKFDQSVRFAIVSAFGQSVPLSLAAGWSFSFCNQTDTTPDEIVPWLEPVAGCLSFYCRGTTGRVFSGYDDCHRLAPVPELSGAQRARAEGRRIASSNDLSPVGHPTL